MEHCVFKFRSSISYSVFSGEEASSANRGFSLLTIIKFPFPIRMIWRSFCHSIFYLRQMPRDCDGFICKELSYKTLPLYRWLYLLKSGRVDFVGYKTRSVPAVEKYLSKYSFSLQGVGFTQFRVILYKYGEYNYYSSFQLGLRFLSYYMRINVSIIQ